MYQGVIVVTSNLRPMCWHTAAWMGMRGALHGMGTGSPKYRFLGSRHGGFRETCRPRMARADIWRSLLV
jgi:hypothetical protein